MKVVGNDILEVPTKFQINRSSVSCEKTELPLLSWFTQNWRIATVIGEFGLECFRISCLGLLMKCNPVSKLSGGFGISGFGLV
ncbi:unnamed protein product [Coffea canephora]|uniref:DH200=94 genomic scaffold, scaffold_372 n=1 Tax=Coffea canephora TaxID=49390 RepID=A0A068VF87_COFCA|nr:unnamed protein product [Coffea canephora]